MNPGGSVKDRAALYLVKKAEERGTLKPGGTVVEGTAGVLFNAVTQRAWGTTDRKRALSLSL